MANVLATYLFGHDLEKIRYPYLASISSALALTQQINGQAAVYFAICDCSDDTESIIRKRFENAIKFGELKIVYHPWRDDHYVQVEICNYLLDQIGEKYAFALKLDSDEVLHDESFDRFAEDLTNLAGYNVDLARPHYTHLLDNSRDFDFIYRAKAVISRTSAGLRYNDNDACALGGSREMQTRLEVVHYGKFMPGREREALYKELSFTKGYKDLGFPDMRVVAQREQGYLDYDAVFENAHEHGQVRSWLGTHPLFAQAWVDEQLIREKQFKQDLASGRVVPIETEKWWE